MDDFENAETNEQNPLAADDSNIDLNENSNNNNNNNNRSDDNSVVEDDETPAFLFAVAEPEQKTEGGKLGLSYWSYKITSNTRLEQYKEKTNICHRRYNDFIWLRESLITAYPGVIVPPLPEKTMLGTVEKFISSAVDTKSLLEYRQRALTKFLTRVGEHPILQTSSGLQQFLEMEEHSFHSMVKSSGKSTKSSSSSTSSGWFKKAPTVKEPEWIAEQKRFVTDLDNSLKSLKTRLQNMITKRKEMSTAIVEFGKAFRSVGEAERSYEPASSLGQSLIEIGDKSDILSKGAVSQAEKETMQVIETLTYYLGMCDSIRLIAKQLESMRAEHEDAQVAVKTLGANIEKFAKQPGKEERVQQLSQTLEETTQKEQVLAVSLQTAEERFQEDIVRFDVERKIDFAYMLDAFITLQIEYSSTVCQSWESLVPSVKLITESE